MIKCSPGKTSFCFALAFNLCFALLLTGVANAQTFSKNDSSIYLADPAIFNNKGVYYLYGTVEQNVNNGFIAYTSTDLINWKITGNNNNGYVLSKGDAFGTGNFWAPQVFKNAGKILMAYAADENIAIATSQQAGGPFLQKDKLPLKANVKQIDPFVFRDDDGKTYLYHVRLQEGNKIFVAEMEDDLSAIKPATLTECITANEAWENTTNSPWPVAEGPTVLKHNNIYYLFYSANDFRNPNYAVGYATSESPYGPWKKYEGNPIISKKNIGVNGTGHGDFFLDKYDNLQYVFHTHFSDSKVWPRKTAIFAGSFIDTPGRQGFLINTTTFHYLFRNKL